MKVFNLFLSKLQCALVLTSIMQIDAHVGGVNDQWEYVLIGDVFKQLEVAVEMCKMGEV